MADIVVNDADLIADQRAQAEMGGSVSAVEMMAEQQAAGLGRVHHHQHQYPALSLSHIVPGQYPFLHHAQQPTLEQVAAASYQQAIGGYLPTAMSTPTAACFCQCVYNPSGYPQSCAIHRTMALPTQQYLMQQPTALYADSPGPSYLHPAPPSMLNAMRIPPPPAARAVPAVNRNQHKRQLHESISVTSSSDDDDINVAGGRGDSLAAGTRTPLRSRSPPSVAGSSKGPRKSLRIHSPPKSAELGVAGGRSTDTIDLAASSDDDEVIEPGGPVPSTVLPSSSVSPVLEAQMHMPPTNHQTASGIGPTQTPSATVQAIQPQQQCRYAHCNCHSHACGCVQCPVAAHCHHFHHHHHAPPLSCQLHSPCGCAPQTNSALDYHTVNRAPPLHDSLRVSQSRQSHQPHEIHPNQQRLRQSQNHQMELNRQAQARYFHNRQRQVAAAQQQRNVAAAAAAAAYLPPTATTFADWAALTTASAALAAAANQQRRYPTSQSPFLMVTPNPHPPPHARNIIMAPNVPMLQTLATHPMPIEFGMLVHAGPILLQSAEGLVFNAPTATEPQPIGASIDQIERCTIISLYAKDTEVPEGEEERCTVCLADFDTGERVRSLQCAHLFHTECIDRWLVYNKKCPVCRVDMDKNNSRRSTFRVSTASN